MEHSFDQTFTFQQLYTVNCRHWISFFFFFGLLHEPLLGYKWSRICVLCAAANPRPPAELGAVDPREFAGPLLGSPTKDDGTLLYPLMHILWRAGCFVFSLTVAGHFLATFFWIPREISSSAACIHVYCSEQLLSVYTSPSGPWFYWNAALKPNLKRIFCKLICGLLSPQKSEAITLWGAPYYRENTLGVLWSN